jgi:hypothetical protein
MLIYLSEFFGNEKALPNAGCANPLMIPDRGRFRGVGILSSKPKYLSLDVLVRGLAARSLKQQAK